MPLILQPRVKVVGILPAQDSVFLKDSLVHNYYTYVIWFYVAKTPYFLPGYCEIAPNIILNKLLTKVNHTVRFTLISSAVFRHQFFWNL